MGIMKITPGSTICQAFGAPCLSEDDLATAALILCHPTLLAIHHYSQKQMQDFRGMIADLVERAAADGDEWLGDALIKALVRAERRYREAHR